MQQYPTYRRARLPGKGRADGRVHRRFKIGVGKNHLRRFAAQIELHPLEIFGGGGHDLFARSRAAGKTDQPRGRMRDERLPHLGAFAAERVDHPGGETGFVEDLHGPELLWRFLVGRFNHDRITGYQCRHSRQKSAQHRPIERHKNSNDTERFPIYIIGLLVAVFDERTRSVIELAHIVVDDPFDQRRDARPTLGLDLGPR